MIVFKNLLLIFVLCLLFSRCTSVACNCTKEPNLISSPGKITQCKYRVQQIKLQLSKGQFSYNLNNVFFGICLYEKKDSLYVVRVDKKGQIVFSNLFDSTYSHRSDFPFSASENNITEMKTFQDTLILVQKDAHKIIKLQINPDFTTSVLQEIDLNEFVKIKNWYIRYNAGGKQFDYKYPYILLPYGKINGVNLYDKQSHLLINTALKSAKSINDFPSCYSTCYVQGESPSAAFGENKIVGLFSLYGEFKELDLMDESVTVVNIPESKPFIEFDKKEIENLAYARKYDLLSEMNTNIFFTHTGEKVIVRRMSKETFAEKDRFRYFVYDKKNILLCSDFFPVPIENLLMRPYKSGFLVFNTSLSQALFYEWN